MALIESGQSASIFSEKHQKDTGGLKLGLFFIGAGLGFLIGMILETSLDLPEASAVIPMCFIGAGVGLVLHYVILRKHEKASNFED